jgi:DNA-binding transcriptional LysR family regulator
MRPDHGGVELDWLETFLAVVDRGGFTAASAHVHRSQSRVSAHIAALERELGTQLVDRTRRPASLTPAGRIFAEHARDILAEVGSARSAIDLLRATNSESLAVLTTPCIGAALFPGVIATVLGQHPRARISLSEHGWLGGEPQLPADGLALAVVPTFSFSPGVEWNFAVLWREPIQALVPVDHELARHAAGTGSVIAPDQLARFPLVAGGTTTSAEPEISAMLAARGLEVGTRTLVDTPQTLVAMVRAGVGVGVSNAVAIENTDTAGVVALNLDDPEMARDVAVYWHDVLLMSDVGRTLQQTVLQAPLPKGAMAAGRSDWRPGS